MPTVRLVVTEHSVWFGTPKLSNAIVIAIGVSHQWHRHLVVGMVLTSTRLPLSRHLHSQVH